VLRYFGKEDDRLVLVNFGLDLHLNPAPEPLLAPAEDQEWDIIFSTEGPRYGGCGVPPADTVENWIVPGQAALVLKPVKRTRTAVECKP
jgi:maltooligosyltrehalose trehalohydrolase